MGDDKGAADKLGVVVDAHGLLQAPEASGLIQRAGHVGIAYSVVDSDVNAFVAEVIRDSQTLQSSPVGERFAHED